MALKPNAPKWMLLLAAALPLAQALAGPAQAGFGVSAQVVRSHQPALADALPLPLPGHVMQEDAHGRHYFFDGSIASARAFYQDQMVQRGYVLVAEETDGVLDSALRFQRNGEVTLVRIQGTPGMGPTRINLLAMRQ
ncbi:hypothetical protein [Cognatiluteimonas telluris]|jgi:hypothetical protein|uniref:hypothetical protein n=1 Tax=Cognatiluteimonas telluris TaxID=1104775 RepID=UPI001409BECD|nr:hypothetical protein [Lysobacter telluris]